MKSEKDKLTPKQEGQCAKIKSDRLTAFGTSDFLPTRGNPHSTARGLMLTGKSRWMCDTAPGYLGSTEHFEQFSPTWGEFPDSRDLWGQLIYCIQSAVVDIREVSTRIGITTSQHMINTSPSPLLSVNLSLAPSLYDRKDGTKRISSGLQCRQAGLDPGKVMAAGLLTSATYCFPPLHVSTGLCFSGLKPFPPPTNHRLQESFLVVARQ